MSPPQVGPEVEVAEAEVEKVLQLPGGGWGGCLYWAPGACGLGPNRPAFPHVPVWGEDLQGLPSATKAPPTAGPGDPTPGACAGAAPPHLLSSGRLFSRSSLSICWHQPSMRSRSAWRSFRNQWPSRWHTDLCTASRGSSVIESIQGSGGGRMEGSKSASKSSSAAQAW